MKIHRNLLLSSPRAREKKKRREEKKKEEEEEGYRNEKSLKWGENKRIYTLVQRDKATLPTVFSAALTPHFLSVSAARETREREAREASKSRDGRSLEEVDISRGENLNKTRGGEEFLFHPLFRLPLPPPLFPLKKCKFSKWKLVESPGQCEPPPRCPQHLRSEYRFSSSLSLFLSLLEFNSFAVQDSSLCSLALRTRWWWPPLSISRIPEWILKFFHRARFDW